MTEEKIVYAPFTRAYLDDVTDEIIDVFDRYTGRLTMAEVLGVLELVKHHVLVVHAQTK